MQTEQALTGQLIPQLLLDTHRISRLRTYKSFVDGTHIQNAYPKTITRLLNGYLVGPGRQNYVSMKKSQASIMATLKQWFNIKGFSKILSDCFYQAGCLGQSWLYLSIEETPKGFDYDFHLQDPLSLVPIYNYENKLRAILKTNTYFDLGQKFLMYEIFEKDKISVYNSQYQLVQDYENPLGILPFISFENPQLQPDFWNVKDYIEKLDQLQNSDLAMLQKTFESVLVTSMKLTEEQVQRLRNWQVVDDLGMEGRFEIKTYDPEHEFRKHIRDYLIQEIFTHTGLFNFTEVNLGTDPSGTALEYRLYPMKLNADEKQSHFKTALYQIFQWLEQALQVYPHEIFKKAVHLDAQYVHIDLQRNLPRSSGFKELLQVKDLISETTLLSSLGINLEDELTIAQSEHKIQSP